jgi:hypothetical protein
MSTYNGKSRRENGKEEMNYKDVLDRNQGKGCSRERREKRWEEKRRPIENKPSFYKMRVGFFRLITSVKWIISQQSMGKHILYI